MRLNTACRFLLATATFYMAGCDFSKTGNVYSGYSKNKEEAARNGSGIELYVANRPHIKLLDGTTLLLDTVWTESSFIIDHGKNRLTPAGGYHLSIPFKIAEDNDFKIDFELLDKSNGSSETEKTNNLIQITLTQLLPVINVRLLQKDPDTTKGWTHSIPSDTVTFKHIGTFRK